jgi:hypothetical protein
MIDLEEAHSKQLIHLCNKYLIVKRATAGYTPRHNAIVDRLFQTNGEMSRCQLSQFNMEEEFSKDTRRHGAWLTDSVPFTLVIQGRPGNHRVNVNIPTAVD